MKFLSNLKIFTRPCRRPTPPPRRPTPPPWRRRIRYWGPLRSYGKRNIFRNAFRSNYGKIPKIARYLHSSAYIVSSMNRVIYFSTLLKVVQLKKITIYPVLKNLRDAALKVSLIDPWYFVSEKYIENAGIKRKILSIRFYLSKQKRWMGLLYCFFVLLYCSL